MSYEQFGVGFDLAQQIKAMPALTQSYLSKLWTACQATVVPFRLWHISGPFDFARLKRLATNMPAVSTLVKWVDAGEFYEQCNEADPLIVPVIRWLLLSHRSRQRELAPGKQVDSFTEYQLVMLMTSVNAQFGSDYSK